MFFFTFSDINECEAQPYPCHPMATCNNTIGSYECTCYEDFEGDGFTSCKGMNQEYEASAPYFCTACPNKNLTIFARKI